MAPTVLQGLTWQDAGYLAPEITLVAAAIFITLLELFLPRRSSGVLAGWLSLGSILLSLAFVLWRMLDMNPTGVSPEEAAQAGNAIRLLGDSYRVDDFANLMKIIFLIAGALIVLMSIGYVKRDSEINDKSEFFTLMLPALTGAMMMVSSGDLITMFVGMELLSISTYVLVGIRKNASVSAEASFKYVVIGGISSALILFGMSYLYGVTGSTNLGEIGRALQQAMTNYEALVYVGFFFLLGGFAIKIAAAPFHAWAPDVYQGAATPVTAFLAVISKGAALAALFRIFYNTALYYTSSLARDGNGALGDDLFLALKVLAAAAMIVGTTAALRQRNVKRLLALSGVANAGYLLVPIGIGLAGLHSSNMSEFVYYLLAYVFMNIGAFAILTVVARAAGHEEANGYAGLYYRAPWTAAAMIVLLLSLAGLPVSGGFFGKLFILLGAAQTKDYWLIAVMIVTSVISYYFYFSLVRQMFLRSGNEEAEVKIPLTAGLTIWICVAATLALGLAPSPVLDSVNHVFSLLGDMFVAPGQ
jgi:NADH-quinone oxidoreductase subunit N